MKKVEERHPKQAEETSGQEEASADEDVIDIEAKPEISFEDFGKCSSRLAK